VAYIWGPGLKATEEEGPTPLRSLGIWRLMAQRFSARLIKTADLDPSQRYVFACYPHGVSAISGWLMFATEATGFGQMFKGEAQARACTHLGLLCACSVWQMESVCLRRCTCA
jgi:hypothetical protein